MYRPPLDRDPPRDRASARMDGVLLPKGSYFGGSSTVNQGAQDLAVELADHTGVGTAKPSDALDQRIEHRLRVGRCAANDSQDVGRRLLLIEGVSQALLQIADPSVVVLGRLASNGGLGFLGLRGLWTPAHWPPLASYESAGDRLGEPVNQGKGTANRP